MRYHLQIEEEVKKQLQRLPGNLRQRIVRIIEGLRDNPRPANAIELTGILAGCYKIVLGQYRIVYEVFDDLVLVEVLRIGKKQGPEFYADIR
ncbi:MAG: type II toxin-antitoxin system RelE/ParE family toxin [Chloroflexota bacterium]|nr:type II toxin-antitoxin system RelE/ParE family toxin [Chloroflexota bacterium]